MRITSERLEHLRELAQTERDAIMEYRGREGEDPLVTLAELPSVDEFVVRELVNEMLERRGRFAEYSMARLAALGSGEEAVAHRANADRAELEILREIADANPELTVAVWAAAGRLAT